MVNVGGIVSVGGVASSSSGSGSGIQSINSQTGPSIVVTGVNGITVTSSSNVITIDGAGVSGISGSGTYCFSRTSQTFTATAAQTIFVVSGGYTVGQVDVYLNGVKLTSAEFTATDGLTVVLVTPAAANDIVEVLRYDCNSSSSGGSGSGVIGVNGITVEQVGGNFVVNGAALSGTSVSKFAASFSSISSGLFTHNLNTLDVIVQVYDNSSPRRAMMPDDILVENSNEISLIFNMPQSGRVVII